MMKKGIFAVVGLSIAILSGCATETSRTIEAQTVNTRQQLLSRAARADSSG